MHLHNHAHGAAHILAVAARGDRVWTVPSIPGHVQHSSDLLAPCAEELTLSPVLTAFVWGRSSVQRRLRLGLHNQIATGAAWLHLLATDPQLLRPVQPIDRLAGLPEVDLSQQFVPSGALIFVEHGLEGTALVPRIVHAARERFGSAFTVALSHRDAATAPLVATYADLAVETVDLGPAADESGSDQPRELLRLHQLMQRHTAVAANTARAEMFYATALERPVHLLDAAPHGRESHWTADELAQMTDAELGRDDMLLPEELTDLFEWSARA